MKPLWTKHELLKATDASDPTFKFLVDTNTNIFGVSINDQTIQKGDCLPQVEGTRGEGRARGKATCQEEEEDKVSAV